MVTFRLQIVVFEPAMHYANTLSNTDGDSNWKIEFNNVNQNQINCLEYPLKSVVRTIIALFPHFEKVTIKIRRGGQAYCFDKMTSHLSIVSEQKIILARGRRGPLRCPPRYPNCTNTTETSTS